MRSTLIGIAIGLALAGLALLSLDWFSPPEPAVIAQPAKELKGEAVTRLDCKPVLVFREKLKEELGVPNAPNRHVVAATQIPGDDHGRTVTATFNDLSGEVTQFVRIDPLSWLDTRQRFGVGFSPYVIGSEHVSPTQSVDAYWQPIQSKAINFRLSGEATADGQWVGRVRIGADWR